MVSTVSWCDLFTIRFFSIILISIIPRHHLKSSVIHNRSGCDKKKTICVHCSYITVLNIYVNRLMKCMKVLKEFIVIVVDAVDILFFSLLSLFMCPETFNWIYIAPKLYSTYERISSTTTTTKCDVQLFEKCWWRCRIHHDDNV